MQTKRILIIIPAYNESDSLTDLIQELRKQVPHCTLLVINDCSTDSTAKVAQKAGASVVSLPINLGIGGAMQTGFKYGVVENYDIAVQVDGDGQHDPAYLNHILEPVIRGELDLCIGSRFLEDKSGFQSTFTRRMGIQFFSRLLQFLTGLPVTDPTSGFRAISRDLFSAFAEYYPIDFPEPEAIMIARRHHAKVGEVSVKMRERQGGITSIRYLSTLYYMIKVTLAILIDLLKAPPKKRA